MVPGPVTVYQKNAEIQKWWVWASEAPHTSVAGSLGLFAFPSASYPSVFLCSFFFCSSSSFILPCVPAIVLMAPNWFLRVLKGHIFVFKNIQKWLNYFSYLKKKKKKIWSLQPERWLKGVFGNKRLMHSLIWPSGWYEVLKAVAEIIQHSIAACALCSNVKPNPYVFIAFSSSKIVQFFKRTILKHTACACSLLCSSLNMEYKKSYRKILESH